MSKDFESGFTCAECGSYVKLYKRKLNSSMAVVCILLARHRKIKYFHVENWLKEIGRPELRADYHKLRFWGLIEAKNESREDGSKRNGYYRITARGIDFAEGRLTVQARAILLHNKLQGFEGKEVTIKECLSSKFNYSELIGNFAPKTDKEKKGLQQIGLF